MKRAVSARVAAARLCRSLTWVVQREPAGAEVVDSSVHGILWKDEKSQKRAVSARLG